MKKTDHPVFQELLDVAYPLLPEFLFTAHPGPGPQVRPIVRYGLNTPNSFMCHLAWACIFNHQGEDWYAYISNHPIHRAAQAKYFEQTQPPELRNVILYRLKQMEEIK